MRVSDKVIVREIAGEYLLIPVGDLALDLHGMINLTESGYLLWTKLQDEVSKEALVEAVLSEYEIDRETAGKDVDEFLGKLNKLGILYE